MIFLRVNLPNFVQFKQYWGKILFTIRVWGAKPLLQLPPPSRKLRLWPHLCTQAYAWKSNGNSKKHYTRYCAMLPSREYCRKCDYACWWDLEYACRPTVHYVPENVHFFCWIIQNYLILLTFGIQNCEWVRRDYRCLHFTRYSGNIFHIQV